MRKEETTTAPRFTSADLESFPDDGKRYEIIDGELYVSKQPHFLHRGAPNKPIVSQVGINSRSALGFPGNWL